MLDSTREPCRERLIPCEQVPDVPGPLALVSAHFGRQRAVLQALGDGRGVPPGTVTPAQLAQLHRQLHAHAQLLITARILARAFGRGSFPNDMM